jgi:hypothetical protein
MYRDIVRLDIICVRSCPVPKADRKLCFIPRSSNVGTAKSKDLIESQLILPTSTNTSYACHTGQLRQDYTTHRDTTYAGIGKVSQYNYTSQSPNSTFPRALRFKTMIPISCSDPRNQNPPLYRGLHSYSFLRNTRLKSSI